MLKNFFKTTFLSIIIVGFLFPSDLFLKKKIQIDDRFRNGLKLSPDLYKIWIGTKSDANINSQYRIEKKQKTTNSKEYIPGLPTVPSAPKTISSNQKHTSDFDYVVYVYIDNSYNTMALKNQMRHNIIDVWSGLNHCQECIVFEAMAFQDDSMKKEGLADNGISSDVEERLKAAENAAKQLESTLLELQEMQDANIAQERTIELQEYELAQQKQQLLDDQFIELEEKLRELEFEREEKEDAYNQMKDFRMNYLEEQYKMHATFKDSLLTRYGQKLDNIYDPIIGCTDEKALNFSLKANKSCDDCCRYDENSSLYILGCMDSAAVNFDVAATQPCTDCCSYEIIGCMDQDARNYDSLANKSCLDCCEYQQQSWVVWLIAGLLTILIILSVFAILGNRKKVVYLKPKDQPKNSSESEENLEDKSKAQTITAPSAPSPQPLVTPTQAYVDEGVLQSEIRTQRQSAVAMSAGQKEGATQIVKDWLSESKGEENSEENSEE